jgi:hypothetical protein
MNLKFFATLPEKERTLSLFSLQKIFVYSSFLLSLKFLQHYPSKRQAGLDGNVDIKMPIFWS